MHITAIGLDIAKNVFQVHGIDGAEQVVVRKQLRRGQVMKFFEALPPCLMGLEGHASKERVLLIGTDQRITSGPAARAAAFTGRIHGCTRTFRASDSFPLHRGRRPYMAHRVGGQAAELTVAIGGTADIKGLAAMMASVANDP